MKTNANLTSIKKHMQNLGKNNPEWMNTFQNFMQSSKKEGALSSKVKELIAVSLSVNSQCDRCITWHVNSALQAGATRDEIIEAGLVAVMMSGGPGLMYMEDLLTALNNLDEK